MIVKKMIALGGMLLLGIAAGPARAEVDAEAAQALAKRNDCFKCHAIDKTKKGPPYTRIAGRLKTKPDAVDVIVEHITSGPVIEFQDADRVACRRVSRAGSGGRGDGRRSDGRRGVVKRSPRWCQEKFVR